VDLTVWVEQEVAVTMLALVAVVGLIPYPHNHNRHHLPMMMTMKTTLLSAGGKYEMKFGTAQELAKIEVSTTLVHAHGVVALTKVFEKPALLLLPS
jgi:hypothetical protein